MTTYPRAAWQRGFLFRQVLNFQENGKFFAKNLAMLST